jgi:hypothetical protein
VSHRAASPLLHRQAGLSAIQSLNLALFVHAKHDRLLRGIQVRILRDSDHPFSSEADQ